MTGDAATVASWGGVRATSRSSWSIDSVGSGVPVLLGEEGEGEGGASLGVSISFLSVSFCVLRVSERRSTAVVSIVRVRKCFLNLTAILEGSMPFCIISLATPSSSLSHALSWLVFGIPPGCPGAAYTLMTAGSVGTTSGGGGSDGGSMAGGRGGGRGMRGGSGPVEMVGCWGMAVDGESVSCGGRLRTRAGTHCVVRSRR
mmetsp:Transcript_10485/g.25383  ORF Transcript_10485/g.25383 Transcript_10485/m.25383 type:complete len:201 (-) Transcript_10485:258-860(-)